MTKHFQRILRGILLFTTLLSAQQSNAQYFNDLVIVEYIDWDATSAFGIKLHNPTLDTLDLSLYEMVLAGNGNGSYTAVQLVGTLLPGDYYIAGNSTYCTGFFNPCKGTCDTVLPFSGVNGNDYLAITKNWTGNPATTVWIDMIGAVGTYVGPNGTSPYVNGVPNALYQYRLVRAADNCTRYNEIDTHYVSSDRTTSWPGDTSTDVKGWTVHSGGQGLCISDTPVYKSRGSIALNKVSICGGQTYYAGGAFQDTSGSYMDSFATTVTCDSLVFTELTVARSDSFGVDTTLSPGQGITVGNIYRTTSGTYIDSFVNVQGCDSLIYWTLAVCDSVDSLITVDICKGQSYFVGGSNQTSSGVFYDTIITGGICDSVVKTVLTVGDTFRTLIVDTVCAGNGYVFGGDTFVFTGNYYDTITSLSGCDSIIRLELTRIGPFASVQRDTLCYGDTLFANGYVVTTGGLYIQTYAGPFGCDSTSRLQVVMADTFRTVIDTGVCFGESFVFQGDTVIAPGVYYDTLLATSGCDKHR